MKGSLVADLGIGPETWMFLTLLVSVAIFFKFGRFWSVRNLDLLMLFAIAPGLRLLVGSDGHPPWIAYWWVFLGTLLWLIRCLLDLGLARRPVLEPNLNASGLACLSLGILSLFAVETVSLSIRQGAGRNPAETSPKTQEPAVPPGAHDAGAPVSLVVNHSPLPHDLKENPHQGLARLLACLAQFGLVVGMVAVGWRHFERAISGLAVATLYLILPYARFALADSGQLIPASLIVASVVAYQKPVLTGMALGFSAAWMPASLGLLPLWAGYYRHRGLSRFVIASVSTLVGCFLIGLFIPGMLEWATALGARRMSDAGIWPQVEAPASGSFWSGIDVSYRLPVWIAYLALVLATSFWPAQKDLGQLIATTAALLVASQFWYLAAGGTLVLLYLPLVILMMFRPNLSHRRASALLRRRERQEAAIAST